MECFNFNNFQISTDPFAATYMTNFNVQCWIGM